MTKKVLLVAYYFHPDLEVGAVRSVKFAKYLPESNWQAVVLTVRTEYYQKVDTSTLPFECAVYRTGKWLTLGDVYFRVKQKLTAAPTASERQAPTTQSQQIAANFPTSGRESLWKRTLRLVFWTPDYQIGWLIPGTWKAIRTVYREKIDIIYTSGPPRTGHWIGLLTSLLTRRPLVSDYRDPLVTLQNPTKASKRLEKRINRWIERIVNRHSALVLTTTPEYRDMLKEIHSPYLQDKCFSILNGFDAEDFPLAAAKQAVGGRPIHFLYAGTLYEGRDPRQFVIALGELVREGLLRKENIVVDFYGQVEIDPAKLRSIIDEQGLTDVITFRPLVERKEYLKLIADADVLVLLQSEKSPVQIPAKTFEYLATGNEIIALAAPGATANFLRSFENVSIAAPDDNDAVKSGIKRIVERLADGKRDQAKTLGELKTLHKRELTKDFARLLNSVVDKN